jgi:Tfp pilus assembly pilus retraction ATPase PilT
MQTGQQHGMQTMDAAVAKLAQEGVLDRPAATLKPSEGGMAAAGGAH